MAEKTIKLKIFRYSGEDGAQPSYDTFDVPYNEDWRVLDAINYIKDELDGTLAYRWSCQMGVCGSCGMMVNDKAKLTCASFLRDYYPNEIKIDPLMNFAVEKDLITDLNDFMEKFKKVKPWLIRKQQDPLEENGTIKPLKQTPAQVAKYKQFTLCINCTLCYAACPVYGRVDEFLGPAALAMARRYDQDSRDQGAEERREVMFSQEGIWECTFVGECSEVCPKHVDPAGAIQQAKLDGAVSYLKNMFLPKAK